MNLNPQNPKFKAKSRKPKALKKFLSIVFYCLSISIYAQDILYKESFSDNYENSIISKLYPEEKNLNKEYKSIYTQKTKENFNLYFIDKREIFGFIINKNNSPTSTIKYTQDSKLLKELLGGISKDSIDILYFSNNNKSKFQSLLFDYKIGKGFINELTPNLDNEKYLESFSYNNCFYLVTCVKNTSIIKIHKIENNNNVSINEYDFSDVEFILHGFKSNLHEYIKGLSCYKISDTDDLSFEKLGSILKFYIDKNKIFLTIDDFKDYTRVFEINLNSNKKKYRKITNNISNTENQSVKQFNSFYRDNKLYQIKGNNKNIVIYVYDLLKESHVQKLTFNKNTTCNDENIPLKKVALDSDVNIKFLEDKINNEKNCYKKFKKIINSQEIGISVTDNNNRLRMHIGGYTEPSRSGGGGIMNGGTMTGGGMITVPTTTTGFHNFGSYYSEGYTEMMHSSISKESLENIKDDFIKDRNEKLKDFNENMKDDDIELSDVIFSENKLIFSYYHPKEKTFYIRKFE